MVSDGSPMHQMPHHKATASKLRNCLGPLTHLSQSYGRIAPNTGIITPWLLFCYLVFPEGSSATESRLKYQCKPLDDFHVTRLCHNTQDLQISPDLRGEVN